MVTVELRGTSGASFAGRYDSTNVWKQPCAVSQYHTSPLMPYLSTAHRLVRLRKRLEATMPCLSTAHRRAPA
eukprot:1005837-Rhodomonas_salina.1